MQNMGWLKTYAIVSTMTALFCGGIAVATWHFNDKVERINIDGSKKAQELSTQVSNLQIEYRTELKNILSTLTRLETLMENHITKETKQISYGPAEPGYVGDLYVQ
jgi:hypothetical protein